MQGEIINKYLLDIKTVYYHGSCPDGITSREILKLQFPDLIYIPYYFTEFKKVPDHALFIDCSPKSNQVEECLRNSCLIAEHHDSFNDSFNKWFPLYPDQMLIGDTKKAESGAILALELVRQLGLGDDLNLAYIQHVARLIAISDTWQNSHEEFEYARMLAGYIAFFGNDFCEELADLYLKRDVILSFGRVQQKKQEQYARQAIKVGKVAFINELNMSNAAEILRNEGSDLVVGYTTKFEPNENRNITIFSLRSKEDGFDCSAFCKAHGGGGHKAAAGFSVDYGLMEPIARFVEFLKKENYAHLFGIN